jgi:hypothetical protein
MIHSNGAIHPQFIRRYKPEGRYGQYEPSINPSRFKFFPSMVTPTRLTCLLHAQESYLWHNFCGQKVRELVKCKDERQLRMSISRGKIENGWENSKQDGRALLILVLSGHRLLTCADVKRIDRGQSSKHSATKIKGLKFFKSQTRNDVSVQIAL